jgi:hypothetical protein
MFHTVFIDKNSHFESIQLKPSDFLCIYVKRVCISYGAITMAQATQILSNCTNIVHLVFWLDWPSKKKKKNRKSLAHEKTSMVRVLSQLPALRRLESSYESLIEIEQTGNLPRWCLTLTHLEVIYWNCSYKDDHINVPILRDFVSLTHLHIMWQEYDLKVHEKGDIMALLEAKPSLQVVLVDLEEEFIPDDHIPVDVRIVYRPEGDDSVEEWRDQELIADKWAVAEQEISRRRRWYERIEGCGSE